MENGKSNGRLHPLQLPEETSKLLTKIEESQFGYREDLQGPCGPRRMVYADYTASGKSLSFIEDYIRSHVLPTYANTHTTTTNTGRTTTQLREEARELIKEALHCTEEDVLVFVGSGCTGALHKLVNCLCLHQLQQPPVVFVSPFEHHANLLPWRESGAEVVWVSEDSSGMTDISDLEKKLKFYSGSGRLLIGSLNAASNISGVLTDTLSFSSLLHKWGALALWDFASAAPYVKMDMNPVGLSQDRDLVYKDAIFFSVHKFVGGPETPGVLVAKKHLFRNASSAPSVPAGGTVSFVTPTTQHYWKNIELREEGGTPQIIGSIRAGLAVHLKEAVGTDTIEEIELAYSRKIMKEWSGMRELCLTGPQRVPKIPIFSFVVRHLDSGRFLHHNFVSAVLNDVFGIQSRGGCMCAGPYAQIVLGIDEPLAQKYIMEGSHYPEEMREALKPGVTRVSFPYFMREEAVDYVIEAVRMIARDGWKLLPQYDFIPETGTFRHCRHSELDSHQRISDITFTSSGEMVYPTPRPSGTSTPSLQGTLEEAKLLFEGAAEESGRRSSKLAQDYCSLMLLGKEMEEMRWFMVPFEAHLYLTGCRPPAIQVPFQPRDYTRSDWYTSQYLNEWDKHWNPSYWEKTKSEREENPVIRQLTIYLVNQSPAHKIQLQPIRDECKGGLREKKAFVSMECLYNLREVEERRGSVGKRPGSLDSSGYSSVGEEGQGTVTEAKGKAKRRRRKGKAGKRSGKSGQVVITYGEDSHQGKKCAIM